MAKNYTAIPGRKVGIPTSTPTGANDKSRLGFSKVLEGSPGNAHRSGFLVGSNSRKDDVIKLSARLMLMHMGTDIEDILLYLGLDDESLSREALHAMRRYEQRSTSGNLPAGNSKGDGRRRPLPNNRKSAEKNAKEDAPRRPTSR